jgi:hypothetical protein
MEHSPLEKYTLYHLSEAWEDYIAAFTNVLWKKKGVIDEQKFFQKMDNALLNLMASGFIEFGYYDWETSQWKIIDIEEMKKNFSLHSFLSWNENESKWMWNELKYGKIPLSIVLKPQGAEYIEALADTYRVDESMFFI